MAQGLQQSRGRSEGCARGSGLGLCEGDAYLDFLGACGDLALSLGGGVLGGVGAIGLGSRAGGDG